MCLAVFADDSFPRFVVEKANHEKHADWSLSLSDSISKSQIESEIANLVSLRHPLFTSLIGFAESTISRAAAIEDCAAVCGRRFPRRSAL
jgi:hypothetical protein